MSSTTAGPTPIERAGGRYYPKLQVSVPFTPGTGRRFLVRAGERPRTVARRADRRRQARCGSIDGSSIHVTFSPRRTGSALGAPGLPAAHRPAVPLAQRGLRDASTTSSPRSPRASARPSGASGATRWPTASRSSALTGDEITEEALGRLLRLLHGHRLAQMGPALSQPRLLLAASASDGRPHPAGHGPARRPLDRRRAQLHRRRRALRPQLGLHRGAPVPAFRGLLLSGDRFAIARGLARVEAGAQGEHKLARGYRPVHDLFGPLHRRPRACAARSPHYLERERARGRR